ncbi:GMC oxidoreductase [Modestobacter excelsi]|uniref:GMC oxidoreductase n=1 Tax=Modestobacter excelsi TaxID=2213161 RepID=UPI00110CAEA4|nr:GMC oxidoreductase [Modestobacter excelsi]
MRLQVPPSPSGDVDLCVVGAGPSGLALALEAADAGLTVVLVEAGQASAQPSATGVDEPPIATVLHPGSHAPLRETTRSAVGGASWLWGGRCVPFEPVDFEARDFIPGSGWPIEQADVVPWQARAAEHLDCGDAQFHVDPAAGFSDDVVSTSQRERWSRRPQLAAHLGSRVLAHPRIFVLTDAVVTGAEYDGDRTGISRLLVSHGDRVVPVTARTYALACGGLGTTRLLLSLQREHPALFGGPSGALGRYYMGHLTGSIATIVLARPDDFGDWGFQRDQDGTFVRRRFTLAQEAQRREGILNTSFHLGNLPFHDAGHRSGGLSLVYLALRAPVVGSRLVQRETRRRNDRPVAHQLGAHVRNVLRHPARAFADVAGVAHQRYLASPRRSVFVLRSDAGTYALRYHAEQVPQQDNRVTLNDGTGRDGLPGIDIDFRYSRQDVDSVLRAHDVLDQQLRSAGYGHLEYHDAVAGREDSVQAQSMDGYHQIGTVRMSADPGDGVVDPDCRVHGVRNLYVASSAVFPTAGEANPTFMAVTLAVRLAHHLAGQLRQSAGRVPMSSSRSR